MSNLAVMTDALEKSKSVRDALMLSFVKERFIKNYEAITARKDGENRYATELFHYSALCEDNPKLKACKKFSHFACLLKAGATGLSFSKEGQLYVIPYGDVAKVQIGAHGKRELIRRMPTVKDILEAQVVYKGDEFVVDKLTSRVIKHEAQPPKSLALDNIVAAYCRILYKDGTHVDVVVYHDEIVKAKSKSKDTREGNVWETWPSQMAKKVPYNRAYILYYRQPEVEVTDFKEYTDESEEVVEASHQVVEPPKAELPAATTKEQPASAPVMAKTQAQETDDFLNS